MRNPLLIALMLLAGVGTANAQVVPPPLPVGSDKVRPEPGVNPKERERAARAHKHKQGFHRDSTRDDTFDQAPIPTVAPIATGKPAQDVGSKNQSATGAGKK